MIVFNCPKCQLGMTNSEDDWETVKQHAKTFFENHKCDKVRVFLNDLKELSEKHNIYIVSEISSLSLVDKNDNYIEYNVGLDNSLGRYFIK